MDRRLRRDRGRPHPPLRPPPPTKGALAYVCEFLVLLAADAAADVARRRGRASTSSTPAIRRTRSSPSARSSSCAGAVPLRPARPVSRGLRLALRPRGLLVRRAGRARAADLRDRRRGDRHQQSYRETAIRRGGVDPDRVFVVRSGPESSSASSACRPTRRSSAGGRSCVAYLGVMAPQDGVDYLLRAAADLIALRGRRDVAFTLIGSGDSFDDLRRADEGARPRRRRALHRAHLRRRRRGDPVDRRRVRQPRSRRTRSTTCRP